jgi:hypothetical protein
MNSIKKTKNILKISYLVRKLNLQRLLRMTYQQALSPTELKTLKC